MDFSPSRVIFFKRDVDGWTTRICQKPIKIIRANNAMFSNTNSNDYSLLDYSAEKTKTSYEKFPECEGVDFYFLVATTNYSDAGQSCLCSVVVGVRRCCVGRRIDCRRPLCRHVTAVRRSPVAAARRRLCAPGTVNLRFVAE